MSESIKSWLACLFFAIITVPAMGEGMMPPEKEEPLEYRDAQLTQEVQGFMRNEIGKALAFLKEKGTANPTHTGELMAYAFIGAIEVSDGLVTFRRDKMPPWVDYESFSGLFDKLNRHIEETVGHISTVEEYEHAMQSFPDADLDEFVLVPNHALEIMILESHGFDMSGIDMSKLPTGATHIIEKDGIRSSVFHSPVEMEVISDRIDEKEGEE